MTRGRRFEIHNQAVWDWMIDARPVRHPLRRMGQALGGWGTVENERDGYVKVTCAGGVHVIASSIDVAEEDRVEPRAHRPHLDHVGTISPTTRALLDDAPARGRALGWRHVAQGRTGSAGSLLPHLVSPRSTGCSPAAGSGRSSCRSGRSCSVTARSARTCARWIPPIAPDPPAAARRPARRSCSAGGAERVKPRGAHRRRHAARPMCLQTLEGCL